jgi:hypothetical protein
MTRNFAHRLLTQIEMLRAGISHQELSKRMGDRTERCLARYLAGKTHLLESEFNSIAEALSMDPRVLAQAWAASLGLRVSTTDAVSRMIRRAYREWRRHSRLAARRVPPSPSPMTVIRAKYADQLPRETPPLWFGSYGRSELHNDTLANRERFARAYQMLVEFVHDHQSQRNVGARHGLSPMRAAQLMRRAAYTWARNNGIDFRDRSVPFKNEAKLVKNLYAALRFFAQQEFNQLATKAERDDTRAKH